jgi:RimJ/RimL family protein N-acetyltransferase
MDRRLAEKVGGLDVLWGSLDNFLARAFGFWVMKGDETISHCCPVYLGDRRFETGVATNEKYRRQGFATLAACAFIARCLDEGLMPEWSCYYVNEASKSLALKLGFVAKPDVEVHYVRMQK